MLNLKSYNGKDLQQFLSMLNQCEDAGVTEIRFIRQKIYEYVNNDMLQKKVKAVKQNGRIKKPKRVRRKKCPDCKIGTMVPVINTEGLHILGCTLCRYSEILED